MGVIYAIVEHGEYDQFGYEFIKIDEADKEKIAAYCEESQKLDKVFGVTDFSRELAGFCKEVEILHSYPEIKTADDLKEEFKEHIKDSCNEGYYLHNSQNELPKLLDFEFTQVK